MFLPCYSLYSHQRVRYLHGFKRALRLNPPISFVGLILVMFHPKYNWQKGTQWHVKKELLYDSDTVCSLSTEYSDSSKSCLQSIALHNYMIVILLGQSKMESKFLLWLFRNCNPISCFVIQSIKLCNQKLAQKNNVCYDENMYSV